MGVFEEMDPELALRLIEGHEDELLTEAKKQDSFYRQFQCPSCKVGLDREIDSKICFRGDTLLAKALLRCGLCGYLIDPETQIILASGNPAKVPEEIPIIGK